MLRVESRGFVVLAALALLAMSTVTRGNAAERKATQSWIRLTGLYVIPTARTLGAGKLAVGYNESKHVEVFSYSRFMDRQIRGSVTAGVGDRCELSVVYQSNQYDVSLMPVLDNDGVVTTGFKWLVFEETRRRPAVAVAVRDLFDSDTDASPLKNVHNGRKYFLLASKRLIEDKQTGRSLDAHVGLANSEMKSLSGLFGAELSITPQISFIAEGMWDSPYVNFRDAYVNAERRGRSSVAGRFIYDIGLRMYPDLLPGLTIDTGFVGDGSFEFSFGMSYVVGL